MHCIERLWKPLSKKKKKKEKSTWCMIAPLVDENSQANDWHLKAFVVLEVLLNYKSTSMYLDLDSSTVILSVQKYCAALRALSINTHKWRSFYSLPFILGDFFISPCPFMTSVLARVAPSSPTAVGHRIPFIASHVFILCLGSCLRQS